jgi:hypothetical protein
VDARKRQYKAIISFVTAQVMDHGVERLKRTQSEATVVYSKVDQALAQASDEVAALQQQLQSFGKSMTKLDVDPRSIGQVGESYSTRPPLETPLVLSSTPTKSIAPVLISPGRKAASEILSSIQDVRSQLAAELQKGQGVECSAEERVSRLEARLRQSHTVLKAMQEACAIMGSEVQTQVHVNEVPGPSNFAPL